MFCLVLRTGFFFFSLVKMVNRESEMGMCAPSEYSAEIPDSQRVLAHAYTAAPATLCTQPDDCATD